MTDLAIINVLKDVLNSPKYRDMSELSAHNLCGAFALDVAKAAVKLALEQAGRK